VDGIYIDPFNVALEVVNDMVVVILIIKLVGLFAFELFVDSVASMFPHPVSKINGHGDGIQGVIFLLGKREVFSDLRTINAHLYFHPIMLNSSKPYMFTNLLLKK